MAVRSTKGKSVRAGNRRRKTPSPQGPGVVDSADGAAGRLEALTTRLVTACEGLERVAAEAPKVSDFEPLAEHLYTFAISAPRLLEGLQEVPKAAATIQASLGSLREVADTLHFSNDRLADSLLKIPRAEDYEPLAAPLREFARVAPALAEALAEVMRVARPLADSVRDLPNLETTLRAAQAAVAESVKSMARTQRHRDLPEHALRELGSAAEGMTAARDAIVAALDSLPRDPEYARFASQLRELAAVSPSLLEWLGQVPQLTVPLEASVSSLRAAADGLSEGHGRVLKALKELGVSPD